MTEHIVIAVVLIIPTLLAVAALTARVETSAEPSRVQSKRGE